jgi:hypothetical protein
MSPRASPRRRAAIDSSTRALEPCASSTERARTLLALARSQVGVLDDRSTPSDRVAAKSSLVAISAPSAARATAIVPSSSSRVVVCAGPTVESRSAAGSRAGKSSADRSARSSAAGRTRCRSPAAVRPRRRAWRRRPVALEHERLDPGPRGFAGGRAAGRPAPDDQKLDVLHVRGTLSCSLGATRPPKNRAGRTAATARRTRRHSRPAASGPSSRATFVEPSTS